MNDFQTRAIAKLTKAGFKVTTDEDFVRVWGFYRFGTWLLTDKDVDDFIKEKCGEENN